MIGIVDVFVQAANPSLPLFPMRAFINSPSSVRVRNVPKKIGNWSINKVQFTATYPDNSIQTANCVLVGGVWVGTISGSITSGFCQNGYSIFADGVDENGNEITGYCLGKGDVQILEADGTITPGETTYYVHLLSAEPDAPKEGDLYQISGSWYIYQDGQAWPIGDDSGLISQLSADITQLSGQMEDKADKQIELPRTISYQLPSSWYDYTSDITLFTSDVEGDTITWGTATQPKMMYNVKTHNLEYTAAGSSEPLLLGVYAPDEIPMYVDYYDEQAGINYYLEVGGFDEYEFTESITKDVVYAEGGEDGILAQISAKQDALTASQLSAVNSGITSEKVAAYDAALSSQVELAEDITYAELVALKNQSKLEAGKTYRITDYKTTTVQANTSADNTILPIVVRAATSTDIDPAGYMPSKKCEIKYCIDNDTSRFAWADTTNGKGVIYWMRDTHGNECPYDFKSILFKPYDPRTNPNINYLYTFNSNSTTANDASEYGYAVNNIILPCHLNVATMAVQKAQSLNNIVLITTTSNTPSVSSNYFSLDCFNIFISQPPINGNYFGNLCGRIYAAGLFSYNYLEGLNHTLAFGYSTQATHLEKSVAIVTCGTSVDNLKSYFIYNTFQGPITSLNITSSQTTSTSKPICANIFGKYLAFGTPVTLDIDIVGQNYEVEYKRTGSKTITFN